MRYWGLTLILIMFVGCIGNQVEEDLVEEGKIIQVNPSELVLTQEDMGDEWIKGRSQPEGENGYFVEFLSKESGLVTDNAYTILNSVWNFSSEIEAKEFLDFYTKKRDGKRSFRFGDESTIYHGSGLGYIIFRENNIVVRLSFFDDTKYLSGEGPEPYAKLIEQKIKQATFED